MIAVLLALALQRAPADLPAPGPQPSPFATLHQSTPPHRVCVRMGHVPVCRMAR